MPETDLAQRRALVAPESWRAAAIGGSALWLASRLLVTTVAMVSQWTQTQHVFGQGSIAGLLFHWDSERFASIAEHGYFSDPVLPAFFPGYPIAARFLAIPLSAVGGEPVVRALFLIAAAAGIGAGILLWRLASIERGPAAAFGATTLFFFGPYSLFLHASYSESLFLVFAIAAWYLARTGRWVWSGIATAAASFVRPNGLFLLVALGVMFVVQRRARGQRIFSPRIFGLAIGVVGALGYLAYLWARTGHPDEWFIAQKLGWDRATTAPWTAAVNTWQNFLLFFAWQNRPPFGLDLVFAVLLVAATVWFGVKRQWPEFTFLFLTAASMLTSTTFVSVARNTLDLFPIVIALGVLEHAPGWRRRVWVGVLVAGVALLCFNTHQFTLGIWAD